MKINDRAVVLGLGFGDEGKGLVVDWLANKYPDSLVVRFSGGHQCSHTVTVGDITHVFANFGSGTLRGVPTYWSKFCTVDPVGLTTELKLLIQKGIHPTLYIDHRCPIVTPYDIKANLLSELTNNHGSCGVGFGTTIKRQEQFYSLTFLDLFYPKILKTRLESIRQYYKSDELDLTDFLASCSELVDNVHIGKTYGIPKRYASVFSMDKPIIFEGSQGLLLDQNFGFFPHVTRSNTGIKNVFEIDFQKEDYHKFRYTETFLVTRAYQTRHGNGFMTNEDIPHNILINPNESNVENAYQGKFRRSLLDASLLEYALAKDVQIRNYSTALVITCLDHIVNEYRFTYKGKIIYCSDEKDFVQQIANILDISNVFLSHSPESSNIQPAS